MLFSYELYKMQRLFFQKIFVGVGLIDNSFDAWGQLNKTFTSVIYMCSPVYCHDTSSPHSPQSK